MCPSFGPVMKSQNRGGSSWIKTRKCYWHSSSPAPDPQSQSVSLTRIRQFSRW
jgi:hypothetical protein